MRRPPPLVWLLLACLALGGLVQAPAWVGGIPETAFTDGQVVGAGLGAEAGVVGTWTTMAMWPDGTSLKLLVWPTAVAALVLPVRLVMLLAWTLMPAFNAACGYALGRALGGSPAAAAVAGGLVAWSPWVRGTLGNGQLEQACVGVVALLWALAVVSERRTVALVGVLGVTVLGGLAAPNLVLGGLVGLGGLAVGRVGLGGRDGRLRRAGAHAGALLCGAGGALGVNAYHAPSVGADGALFRPSTGAMPGHELVDTVTLGGLAWPAGLQAGQDVHHVVFLGWVVMTLAVVALGKRVTPAALAAGLLALVFGFGPSVEVGGQHFALPMALVEVVAPIAAKSGTAYRFVAATAVGLAVAGGLALGDRRWAAGLVALAWFEASVGPGHTLPQAAEPLSPNPELVDVPPGVGALLDLPLARGPGCRELAGGYFRAQTSHGRPLLHNLDAPADYAMGRPTADRLRGALASPGCAAALPGLLGEVEVVVLHDDLDSCPPPAGAEACLTRVLGAPAGRGGGVTWWLR